MRVSISILLSFFSALLLASAARKKSRSRATQRAAEFAEGAGLRQGRRERLRILFAIETIFEKSLYARRLRSRYRPIENYMEWEKFRKLSILLIMALPPIPVVLSGEPAVFPFAAFLSLALPFMLIGALKAKFKNQRLKNTEELISHLAVYLKCGIPLREVLPLCAPELNEISPLLSKRFSNAVTVEDDPVRALLELSEILKSEELELISRICEVSTQTGSSVRAVLESIDEMIRERAALRREIEASSLQGRISGFIVASLPIAFLAMSSAFSRTAFRVLVLTPGGVILVVIAVSLDILGFLWIRRILRADF